MADDLSWDATFAAMPLAPVSAIGVIGQWKVYGHASPPGGNVAFHNVVAVAVWLNMMKFTYFPVMAYTLIFDMFLHMIFMHVPLTSHVWSNEAVKEISATLGAITDVYAMYLWVRLRRRLLPTTNQKGDESSKKAANKFLMAVMAMTYALHQVLKAPTGDQEPWHGTTAFVKANYPCYAALSNENDAAIAQAAQDNGDEPESWEEFSSGAISSWYGRLRKVSWKDVDGACGTFAVVKKRTSYRSPKRREMRKIEKDMNKYWLCLLCKVFASTC